MTVIESFNVIAEEKQRLEKLINAINIHKEYYDMIYNDLIDNKLLNNYQEKEKYLLSKYKINTNDFYKSFNACNDILLKYKKDLEILNNI